MTRRRHLNAALLAAAALIAAAVPAAASAGTAHARTAKPAATAQSPRAAAALARLALGTVKGRIIARHRLKSVDIILYVRKTAEDRSKGWVVSDYQFATDYGLSLDAKTGDYSFQVKPGTYRLAINGVYASGHDWGVVGYGPGKPAGGPFGKSVKVVKGKVTKHINVKAAGDFGPLKLPDPAASLSPNQPTAGGKESVVLGAWPKRTVFDYTWQIGNSEKVVSFKRTMTVPATAGGKSIGVDVYAYGYGKDGAGDSIATIVAK
jgi:hypothetical protein